MVCKGGLIAASIFIQAYHLFGDYIPNKNKYILMAN